MKSCGNRLTSFDLSKTYMGLLFALAFYYQAYRYPFQINSSGTSPTYRDTPFLLSLAKYFIFAALIFYYSIKASLLPFGKVRYGRRIDTLVYLFLLMIPLWAALLAREEFLAETGIFFAAGLPLVFFALPFDADCLFKVEVAARHFMYALISVEIGQLLLFILFNRLPALAFEGTASVRFGSVWDDPNGFALIISFFIPFIVYQRGSAIKKGLLILAFVAMLFLTQSFGGIISTIAGVLIAAWLPVIYKGTSGHRLKYAVILLSLYCGMAALFFGCVAQSEFFTELLNMKTGSIESHLASFQFLREADLISLAGLSPYGRYGECGYVNIILNFGVLYLVAYLYVGFAAVMNCCEIIAKYCDRKGIEVFYGALTFIITFYVGMIAFPVDTIFPLNLLFVLFIILAGKGKEIFDARDCSGRTPGLA